MIKRTSENKARNEAGALFKHPKVESAGILFCGNHDYIAIDKDKLELEAT